jgi:DNA-binding NarL/FixJ family response regulator
MTALKRARVLIADDHPELAAAVQRLLETDYDVVAIAPDGAALLKAAQELRPDVVLLDLNMPEVHGLEACRRLARTNPEAKLIVLSAFDDRTLEPALAAAGACAFVSKYSIANDLVPAIEKACADG